MTLIINIPDDEYKTLKTTGAWHSGLIECIKNGTPLDDIKFHIEHMACKQYEHRLMLDRQEVVEILDNIGKAESEDKE